MLKRFLKVLVLLSMVTLFLCALALNTREAQASSSPWTPLHNPFSHNAGTPKVTFPGGMFLNDVAAVSTSDVWAVGYYINSYPVGFYDQTLIEHWDGTQWSIVSSPNPGTLSNSLAGIVAISANDIWAVGSSSNNTSTSQTLIEHWNGTQWSIVSSPDPGSIQNGLDGIAAVSASNIWAVGSSSNNTSTSQNLIEHWDGTRWSVVSSPNPGAVSNGLNGIAVISASNIWAVGSSSNDTSSQQTLVEHWNGSRWSVVSSPNPTGSTYNVLSGVAAVSTNNVWAVGSSNTDSQTLIEHWNGSQWSIVSSPNLGQISLLDGVAAVSSKNIWAVGQSLANSGSTLIEHWNGSKWSIVSSPNAPGSVNNFLVGIAVISANDIWAVGGFQTSSLAGYTLTEHWNGSQWSVITSPDARTRSGSINDHYTAYLWKTASAYAGQENWIMAKP